MHLFTDKSSRATIVFLLLSKLTFAQNVGIGTNNPTQKLHVVGNTFLAGNVGIGQPNPLAPLHFASNEANRKIVLWQDPAQNNDHQFFGFGINNGLLRYQTYGDHVFYTGINATASKELLRLRYDGIAQIPGSLIIGTGASPGYLTVTGNSGFSGTVAVAGDATFNGNVIAANNFNVTGNSDFAGAVTVVGDANLTGNAYVTNNLFVGGTANIGHTYSSYDFTVPGNNSARATLPCPQGTKLLSGGGGNTSLVTSDDTHISYNGPSPGSPLDSWTLTVRNSSGNSIALRIYCICARIN